ncbi:vWA domain-containing protein [Clostridium uliginosum]|uniref:von Willebrand factor type A domain-containing protein n=1 Tax=Clostridium uliginosum TaxID=119641 RepID=A0A1I1PGT6_9CLOT|nr:vWA domain-containing protein [Clostridium uliginosum]SFD09059.1 von Willebrand factor type A domain-containing protein [Clostridium uliginosum]
MKIEIIKNRKNVVKKVSLFVTIIVFCTLMNVPLIKADDRLQTEPSFEVQINKAKPNPALVGEDITIEGTITPKPFEMEIKPQKKEIVLVLDVSGSMNDPGNKRCTNKRVRYCIKHGSSDPNHLGFGLHHWINDYCEEHKTNEEHYTTKIAELKTAANNFIDKMKNIPNLEIGIVDYSTNAKINPFIKNNDEKDYKSGETNNWNLHYIINKLRADGGTNTGEGLRKTEYMIENGDSDASKSIVFMSDGLPTYYSVEKKYDRDYNQYNDQYYDEYCGRYYDKYNQYYDQYYNKEQEIYYDQYYNGYGYPYYRTYYDYYTSIDNTDPILAGTGNSDNKGYCKGYAKEIGEIIRNNKSNVFSIGYGLGAKNSDGNKTMKEIHDSMGGAENDFFATDAGAIDKIFDQIADKIIKSYTIDNLEMNMNFKSDDGFSLNIKGNKVKLNNIIYKKVSESNGKARYEADKVSFKFVIKGKKVGEYIGKDIFKDSTVTFSWENDLITIPVKISDDLIIKIKDNQLPDIKANFISASPNPANPSEEIEVKYKIDTDSFEYNIGEESLDSTNKSLTITDAKLNFDLGENFDAVDGSVLEGEGKIRTVTLPHIEYTLKNEDGKNVWKQTKPIDIIFKIKASKGKYGSLGFGTTNNKISYKNFTGNLVNKPIKTPTIIIRGIETVNHGLYKGMDGNDPNIDTNTASEIFLKEAKVRLGATFNVYSNGSTANLNIPNGIVDGSIKVYKVGTDGLISIGEMSKGDKNNYTFAFNNVSQAGDRILILYNEILPDETGNYDNKLKIDNAEGIAILKVGSDELPELF